LGGWSDKVAEPVEAMKNIDISPFPISTLLHLVIVN
jgi:hypothetical protein